MNCLKASIHAPGLGTKRSAPGKMVRRKVGRGHAEGEKGEDEQGNKGGLLRGEAESGAHEGRGAGSGGEGGERAVAEGRGNAAEMARGPGVEADEGGAELEDAE